MVLLLDRERERNRRLSTWFGCLLIVGSGFVLAACEAPDVSSPQRAEDTPSGPTADTASRTQAGQEPSLGQWDPGEWEPTVTVVPPTFSDEERQAWSEQRLAMYARDLDGPPPDIEVVRWTETMADYGVAIEECLGEQGFTVEHDGRGGFDIPNGVPPHQEDAYNMAVYSCEATYPINPVFMQEWSSEQLGLLYDYWDQYFIPCLAAHNITVNTADKPSREVYISKFHTPDRTNWWPIDYLARLTPSEKASIEPVCPPQPPPEVFYGTAP